MQENTVKKADAFTVIRIIILCGFLFGTLSYIIPKIDFMSQAVFPFVMIPLVATAIFAFWWCLVKAYKCLMQWKRRRALDTEVYQKDAMFFFSIIIACLAFWILTGYWEWQEDRKTMYIHDNSNRWSRFDDKIYIQTSTPGFDGYHVGAEDLRKREVSLGENSPFSVSYHIDPGRILEVLSTVGPNLNNGLGNRMDTLVRVKSYKFFFLTSVNDLKNDALRLKLFAEYYRQYGLIVDSVDFP